MPKISRLSKIAKNMVIEKLVQLYFGLHVSSPVWNTLNSYARALYQKNSKQPDPAEERIIRELVMKGIAITHLDELFPEENLLPRLQIYAEEEFQKGARLKEIKNFLESAWDTFPVIESRNPFVELALHPRVLAIVNGYMGMYTRFFFFTLNRTVPIQEGAPEIASQRWHRDPEDKKLCKMFLYLNEVDESAGPFIYIPFTAYGLRWNSVCHQRPPRGSYPETDEIFKIIPKEKIVECKGKAGTVIFADTAGLHKGGYAVKKRRIMFTAGFYSSASPFVRLWRQSAEKYDEMEKMFSNPAVRFALEAPPQSFSTRLLYWYKNSRKR